MDVKAMEVMDPEEQKFIVDLIYLAKEMPKEMRDPFIWIGTGLSLAKSGSKYAHGTTAG